MRNKELTKLQRKHGRAVIKGILKSDKVKSLTNPTTATLFYQVAYEKELTPLELQVILLTKKVELDFSVSFEVLKALTREGVVKQISSLCYEETETNELEYEAHILLMNMIYESVLNSNYTKEELGVV